MLFQAIPMGMTMMFFWHFELIIVDRYPTRDESMPEDHRAPEATQLPKAWTRGRILKMNGQKRAAQRVRSWTGQNEILSRITAYATKRIFKSRDESSAKRCVRCREKVRKHNERDEDAEGI